MAVKTRKSDKGKASRSAKGRRTKSPGLGVWLFGGGIAALIVGSVVFNQVQRARLPGDFYPSQGNAHIALGTAHPPYNSNPPTSGWHTPELAPWGSHDTVLPDQQLVHNMEDAGVILWYEMGTPEENRAHIERLEEASRGYRRIVIVPREDMDTTYALTAWTRLDAFNEDEFDLERIRTFIDAYEGIDHHPRY